ncbi:LOW QUALITY PROTEIN: hypothetical protein MAR_002576 [Mya arenaria]|uniref:Tc1-like transposase DDE domain-containing protein n=1 Tax=Mya arenaria TaxID=6604 RepID=A0ABY7G3I0_MYAAR|nr:LOW QUALITY PROTEIN: hypothetical protein MAR_002576 [Mya arenaria]
MKPTSLWQYSSSDASCQPAIETRPQEIDSGQSCVLMSRTFGLLSMTAGDVCGGSKISDSRTEHDMFGGPLKLVWGWVSYDGSSDLYVIPNGSLTGARYLDDILDAYVRPYYVADFVLMDDNARLHRSRVVNEYIEREGIERMTGLPALMISIQ